MEENYQMVREVRGVSHGLPTYADCAWIAPIIFATITNIRSNDGFVQAYYKSVRLTPLEARSGVNWVSQEMLTIPAHDIITDEKKQF